jgi:hypothetical protein
MAAQVFVASSQKNPALSQQFGFPIPPGLHGVPLLTPKAWHVPAAPALGTTHIAPSGHAVGGEALGLHAWETPTTVAQSPLPLHSSPGPQVAPDPGPQAAPAVFDGVVHMPHVDPTMSHTSVAHWASSPQGAPPAPAPTFVQAVVPLIGLGIGPLEQAAVSMVSWAVHEEIYAAVTPLPGAARLREQSATREVSQAASVPNSAFSAPGSHALRNLQ